MDQEFTRKILFQDQRTKKALVRDSTADCGRLTEKAERVALSAERWVQGTGV
jgi:hypothetical protein